MADDHETLIESDTAPAGTIFLTEGSHICDGHHAFDQLKHEQSFADSCIDYDEELSKAPPLQDLYRYHVFFSHCAADIDWVTDTVRKLQAAPFCYKCYYLCEKFNRRLSIVQNLLCAAMLSERVVLVLTRSFLEDTWPDFQDILKSLTTTSLHKQRMLVVLLEECPIPEQLEHFGFIDAKDPDFFHIFTSRLKSGRLPRSSQSISSDLAAVFSPRANLANGHVLATIVLEMRGYWRTSLVVASKDDEVPTALRWHGINMTQDEYWELVQTVAQAHGGSTQLPWIFSIQPVLVLLSAFGMWTLAFITVIVVLVDDSSGGMFPSESAKRIIVPLHKKGNVNCVNNYRGIGLQLFSFNNRQLHFLYFNVEDCVTDVNLLICSCLNEDSDKLLQLIQLYTRDVNYISQVSLAERLTVMMAAPYALKLACFLLPYSAQERHTNKLLCLCQFTEECVSSFIHFYAKEDVAGLVQLFTISLFCATPAKDIRRIFDSTVPV
ncbi:uncharacterized protein LOC121389105 [Gigantopelta aegis]|uniref:uncharacterized protein LOC121389105 n=1 Tax=Gigantopelta aegis TaxID=1735272 RepID=UPI001B888825|nr:uncharacterized protein LOC121389105 [Gigantopelta aegis]